MQLTETTPIPTAALPLDAFRAHLRLGTGFGTETLQDPILEAVLRSAIAMAEGETGKALLRREFRLRLTRWRRDDAQVLPVAPVVAVGAVALIDGAGVATVVEQGWRFVDDAHWPEVVATGAVLPRIPQGGAVEVTFTAGYGATWGDLPADLAQAVMVLAARLYEARDGQEAEIPYVVRTLLGRYRGLRITAGLAS